MKIKFALLALALLASGCKSPFDRTKDASGGGALGTFGPSNSMVVFSDELKTGGGAFLYPGGENQVLSFADTSNPVSARSIRYHWNGQDVSGGGHNFAGFDLIHATSLTTFSTTPPRDLRAAGYTQVTFFARGSLSTNTWVKVHVADDGDTGTNTAPCIALSTDGTLDDLNPVAACNRKGVLSTSWAQYTVPIVPGTNLYPLREFMHATMIYNTFGADMGTGGTIYFDAIQYIP